MLLLRDFGLPVNNPQARRACTFLLDHGLQRDGGINYGILGKSWGRSETKELRQPAMEKMSGHWVLARMGKRVLRPGGLELTRRLLAELAISPSDDVVEFAPGLGVTARLALAQKPKSYTAVERDPNAVAIVERYLAGKNQKCILGSAEGTSLPDQSATVVYGEAMLSMQPATTKLRIVREAARLRQ